MLDTTAAKQKTGFAVLVGRSNVGKSTLLNTLVGTKVAITTPKPQTTRLPVQGILTRPDGQVVFVDTPGLMKKAKDMLTKKLLDSVKDSLKDVDVIVYVADPTRSIGDEEKAMLAMIRNIEKPKILVINKADLNSPPFVEHYRDLAAEFTRVIDVSALTGMNVNALADFIFESMPEGEPYYPLQQLTNMKSEIWLAELIREKLFLRLRQEVPYTTHVEVEEMETREDGTLYVRATVYTTEERYKRMIIGKGGQGIKEIGQSTRNELEAVMQKKVFLDLTVEVDAHWVERLS
ncbi:GTPase Era [Candidatus Uhrbacteria bacterium RIFOXYB12_FULL_58_10]|uniref:GTPase Era n=1 Tax=Candidatus Uhrbacteria bacterium RIFOXYB2_FULL_57_15 TaxID=1802422 RepID=A0A1F7W8D3_9BACT|nr:MAG: GTPase Era [Candidatus Uhrbacteria bacterium RIFOXYB12_FULL_58_10]OGL98487.1 MAG: GTPase Era [Candidatus Uhrbacteria bacterium RIFOXYB2_FULL_57_15]OGL99198.1 MAG: GTPase Era [Candidatus Uhrbacteria bacterium RIFOXYC12_FULL_57_11]